jgi:hypothetical protein
MGLLLGNDIHITERAQVEFEKKRALRRIFGMKR